MFSQALQLALLLLTSSFALAQEEEVSSGSAECTSSLGFYDLKLHVIAIFLLLVSSSIGVFLPLILGQRAGSSTKIENIFFVRTFSPGFMTAVAMTLTAMLSSNRASSTLAMALSWLRLSL